MHSTVRSALRLSLPLSLAAFLGACGGGERRADTDTAAARQDTAGGAARRVTSVDGFDTPESVRWDSAGGVWFVSNIAGNPTDKDNNGFISRLRSDGTVDSLRFIAGGRGDVPLHAPKGMAIRGNELWVSDIDVVHVFDRTTGAHTAHVDLKPNGAVFLNDVATGPDGTIYVTDTGVRFGPSGAERAGPDRIYRIDPTSRVASVAFQSDSAGNPNGITWNPNDNRFVVVPFGSNTILAWTPGNQPTTIATGPGMFDGVEIASDGRILVSSWADSSVWAVRDGTPTKIISGVPSPADIGLDRQGNRLAIPVFTQGRVEIWELGTR